MRTVRDDVEIEPLGDRAWDRIERRVLDGLEEGAAGPRPERPPRPTRLAAALVFAWVAVAALSVVLLLRSEPSDRHSSRWWIETGETGSQLALGDAWIVILPSSALLVSGSDAEGVLLVLDHGGVECEVAPRRGRPPFVVQAGDVRVRVVGTHFTVRRSGQDVDVAVAHGTVEGCRRLRGRYGWANA